MSYLDLSIKEIHEAILSGKVTPLDLVAEALKRAKEDTNNAFEYICEKEAIEQVNSLDQNKKDSPLFGIPFVLKDNFSTKDIPTCASSNILKGYTPIYSSEVYHRLLNEGAILIGKTTLDELAMGGTGKTGHLGRTFNPWDPSHKHIVGGSSCGSAAACANSIVPLAIGSDTGDSVRKPASHAGLVGLKPTWGRISRFGLFPFAPSMDHVAFFTRNVEDSAIVLNVLAGRDEKDSTSSLEKVDDYTGNLNLNLNNKKFAVVKEILDSIPDKNILDAFNKLIELLRQNGAKVDYVSIDENLCKAIYPTYVVISCAEATSNNANLDGIKFGQRFEGQSYEEVMTKARTEGFSELIKRRFVIGSYSLMKENQHDVFLRAQKCRRLIVNRTNEILNEYDEIILPAAPSTAPLFDGIKGEDFNDVYDIADNYLAIGNFAGLPSITLPLGFEDGMPFGVNLTGRKFEESLLFGISQNIEKLLGFRGLSAKGARK